MVYVFLGIGGFWAVMGVMQLFESWGDVDGLKSSLASLVMAGVNLAVAWFLHWRRSLRR